jgi:hypothetical protein
MGVPLRSLLALARFAVSLPVVAIQRTLQRGNDFGSLQWHKRAVARGDETLSAERTVTCIGQRPGLPWILELRAANRARLNNRSARSEFSFSQPFCH